MRHFMMLVLIIGLLTGVFAHSMTSVRAEEQPQKEVTRYYTSHQCPDQRR